MVGRHLWLRAPSPRGRGPAEGGGSRLRAGSPATCALRRAGRGAPARLAPRHLPGEATLLPGRQAAADLPPRGFPGAPPPLPASPLPAGQQPRAPGAGRPWDKAAPLRSPVAREHVSRKRARSPGSRQPPARRCLHQQSMRARRCARLMERGGCAHTRRWPHRAAPPGPSLPGAAQGAATHPEPRGWAHGGCGVPRAGL